MPADTKIIELRQFLAERLPRARLGVAPERMVPATLPTGIESIDQGLGGGLPQGAFTELVAPGECSGSAQFIHALLRHTASGGRFLTLVDGADSLDIDALEPEALAHLLWVRCRNTAEALQTMDLLLRDRNIALVVLDLKLNAAHELRSPLAAIQSAVDSWNSTAEPCWSSRPNRWWPEPPPASFPKPDSTIGISSEAPTP